MTAICRTSFSGSTTTTAATPTDIKREMMHYDDDVLLVKSEPLSTLVTSLVAVAGDSPMPNGAPMPNGSSSGMTNGSSTMVNGLVNGAIANGSFGQFGGAKRPREEWLGGSPPAQASGGNLSPTPGPPYGVTTNGYSSPMSSGSYDPYSPNGKMANRAYHDWLRHPNGKARGAHVEARNSSNSNVRQAKDDYGVSQKLAACPNGGRSFWALSKARNSCESSSPPLLKENGAMVTTPNEKADLFAAIFAANSTLNSQGREDLSPPSSLNGYSADSCDGKKKKGPTPRQQEELCLVCGDRASGYHYNALTCEGCKGFFRRSITKNAVYQCKYGNNCEIDMYMRRKCQECRLKKCLHVGMRPECVVPEVQCAVKRKEKKAQKDKDKPNSTTNGSPDNIIKIEPDLSDGERTPLSNGMKNLSPEQEELINRLVYFQNEYEHPSEEDVKRIINQPMEGEDQCDIRFRHITEITILTVQLIVEFAKRLPGFDKLLREDQIALLKACSSEVMMFRMARRYDVQSDSILFVNNQTYSRDSYNLAGMGETIEDLLHFCRTMYSMKVDNAEYALLTAIVIFSERPSLLEAWKVEKIQEIYLEALRAYVDSRRQPRPGTVFAKLLSVLTELRTLGNQNSEMCFSLKLKNKKIPPFLAEIWDVDVRT